MKSVYEQEHVQVDAGFSEDGPLIGQTLQLRPRRHGKETARSSGEPGIEEAARLRDEVKRLKALELP